MLRSLAYCFEHDLEYKYDENAGQRIPKLAASN